MTKAPRKKNALGRGLGALLEDSSTNEATSLGSTRVSSGSINEISLDQIQVNPFQPRTHFDRQALEELAESIKVQGIIQPITVRRLSEGEYQLISGERRFQASKMAGLDAIPAYVRTADDQQMLEMALIENIQRENLNAIEVALSYQRLLSECDLKQEQLGDRVGKNRTTVNNYLRLLKLPPDVQAGLRDKKISMGHARAIINVEDVDMQLHIFKKAVEEDLSVRKVEQLVRDLMIPKAEKVKPQKQDGSTHRKYEVQQIQSKLSSHFGTRVGLKADGQFRGEIKIPFVSTEDLNRILEIIEL
ncbi:MAG: ParB/RepB/Spo0J family partition protein [Roseivirga sp.]|nr:ParB/RepB/Spo0J family partition protein [Roseivirga sp.]